MAAGVTAGRIARKHIVKEEVLKDSPQRGRRPRTLVSVALAAIVGLSAVIVPATADAAPRKQRIDVMTRNIYLGADLTAALTAANQVDLFERAWKVTDNVRETNFPARAKLLAQEIADNDPELVGLQEVALWRRGPVGTFDGPQTPSTEVVYDFLSDLTNEMRKRGLRYRVAVVQEETDFEVPIDNVQDGQLGNAGNPSNLRDARLTMRDVILVKRGIRVDGTGSAQYETKLPVDIAPPGPGPENIEAPRGYTYADVSVGGRRVQGRGIRGAQKLRFVNTHLESFSAFIRNSQAFELVNGDAVNTNRAIVLVGDLNSDPDDPTSEGPPTSPPGTPSNGGYVTISAGGFGTDLGVDTDTCCQAANLLNATSQIVDGSFNRIDHILTNNANRVDGRAATLIGNDPAMKTPTGLWPSDHAGVVTRIVLGR